MSSESQNPRAGEALPDPDEALLREARALMPPVDAEPRPGFAAKVALHAAEARSNRGVPRLWRFAAVSGGLLAATAALVLAVIPRPTHHQETLAANERAELILRAQGGELAMAERLDLYEELAVVQNQDALEDLDVVAVLHELRPEAKP